MNAAFFNRLQRRYRTDGLAGIVEACSRAIFRTGPQRHPLTVALEEVCSKKGFTIVQFGAFTGNTPNDPLYHAVREALQTTSGTLVVVEPVHQHFKQLQEAYRNIPGVICIQAAIAEFNGPAPFYHINVDPRDFGYPGWLQQLGSLKKERMEELWDRYESTPEYQAFCLKHRAIEMVECLTCESLLRDCGLDQVDILQIDVEGYEYEILQSLPFDDVDFRFINYENVLLQDCRRATEALMRKNGFLLEHFYMDTFCYRSADAELAKEWRKRTASTDCLLS